ncbi:TATA element modulatory factor 1 TATA binding domain-containing protein [Sarocladium implicatum]|nr:TATA element modulatory factor 1 TATA binding domain-containing protein [Sarocladium implicatum]
MAAPGKQSVWGSFLQSAVTGMETRLDTMLDGDEQPQHSAQRPGPAAKPASQPQSPDPVSRSSSNARMTANDRLQARLAKAMAGKGGPDGKGGTSPRQSVDRGSQGSRPSMDADRIGRPETPRIATPTSEVAEPPLDTATDANKPDEGVPVATTEEEREAVPASPAAPEPVTEAKPITVPTIVYDDAKSASEEVQARHQEEVQEYIERIDSLQSKLQYLSQSAAESAKEAASAADSGSAERKLAEKDEKIALLLQEGQKLSSTEGKYRITIKKLRQQITDGEKQADELRKAKDKVLSELEAFKKRQDSEEEKEKRQEEARKVTASLQKEIDALKKDRSAKEEQIKKMEQDAKKKAEQAEAAHAEALSKALATERQKQKELEDNLSTARTEKDALADQARLETIDWREKLDRAAERSRTVEAELKHELRNMESKLEAMRTAAEEATSGSGGEAQLKLLRQIETLQSQYATASDNWQGIEASLLAKVANLEKERDEAQRRESEMRKKAREAAGRLRTLEEELQDTKPALAQAQQELESCREQLATLRTSSKSTETALEQAKSDLEKQQRAAAREFPSDSDRRPWLEDVAGTPRGQSRPDSPLLSVPRTFSSDLVGLPLPGRGSQRAPTPGSAAREGFPDGLGLSFGRRLSSQPPTRPGPLPTTNSGLFSGYEGSVESPNLMSPPPLDRDDIADTAPSSPRNVAQDMISVSTNAAGPSVQLVERMSAAIRRLEAEKVAAKEEMARVCSQRDEARSELGGLMKDLEEARTATVRVKELEGEVGELNGRYEATLELLGEKSELVEELKADVQDVKEMYRELVERTVK